MLYFFRFLQLFFFIFCIIERVPPTFLSVPLARFMFLDELKSRMQIKFACF